MTPAYCSMRSSPCRIHAKAIRRTTMHGRSLSPRGSLRTGLMGVPQDIQSFPAGTLLSSGSHFQVIRDASEISWDTIAGGWKTSAPKTATAEHSGLWELYWGSQAMLDCEEQQEDCSRRLCRRL